MRPVTIAVLGRFPDIFGGFVESADKFFPDIPKVFVRDGNDIVFPTGEKWTNLQGIPPFSNPGYANLAWQGAAKDSDILYCGDDVRFLQSNTVEVLQQVAYSDPKIGMLSPRILGQAGNYWQLCPKPEGITYTKQRLALICTYIKRETIDVVGYMDNIFGGSYGYDDDDYNFRVRRAGFTLAVTPLVSVEHQHAASTFTRTGPGIDCTPGEAKFRNKWGDEAMAQLAAELQSESPPVVAAPPLPTRTFRRLGR